MTWGYGREHSYLRTQLDDYKEKLKGATPQEARDQINQLEELSTYSIDLPGQEKGRAAHLRVVP
jgi:hypothetical protein